MKRSTHARGLVGVAFAATLALTPGDSARAESRAEDIDYICAKERQLLEADYQAQTAECEAYRQQHSVEEFKRDPQVIAEAEEATRQAARVAQASWPVEKQGWWIFSSPAPLRSDPWNDARFNWEQQYRIQLDRLARERAMPHTESLRMKLSDVRQQYEAALADLDRKCQRSRDLNAERERKETERKARKAEEDRLEQELSDRIAGEKKLVDLKAKLERGPGAGQSLESFIEGIEDASVPGGAVVIKPGRFDAKRRRWAPPVNWRSFTPEATADSVAAVLPLVDDNSSGNGKETGK